MIKGIEALKLLQEGKELKSGEISYVISKEQKLKYRVVPEQEWSASYMTIDDFMQVEFELVREKEYNYYEAVALAFEGWELKNIETCYTMSTHNRTLITAGGSGFVTTLIDLDAKWVKVKRKEK